jgi:hypothetical protein
MASAKSSDRLDKAFLGTLPDFARRTLAELTALPPEQQVTLVWLEGTFRAHRWEEGNSIHLCGDLL